MGRSFEIEYNSEKGDLKISEYGRNVQNLVNYCVKIKDEEERYRFSKEIINLMNIMNPHNRNLEGYQEKLWNHLFSMSNYKLNIPVPDDITIHPPADKLKDYDLGYPTSEYKYRHYGHYIQQMIRKALTMEDLEKRNAYSEVIASYMKLAYRTWNKEHFVSDSIIKNDLEEMSGRVLSFEDDYTIENLVSFKNLGNNNQNSNNRNRKSSNNNNRKFSNNGKSNSSNSRFKKR